MKKKIAETQQTGGIKMTSLTASLVNSRNEVTAVKELVQLIEMYAQKRGLTVSRWQTNKGNYDCTVTWAVHEGERPNSSGDLPESSHTVSFKGLEGKTKRCKAYKELYWLLEQVR